MSQSTESFLDKMRKIYPIIKSTKTVHKGTAWSGTVVCPVCGGELSILHCKSNGHTHGQCASEDCVSWHE